MRFTPLSWQSPACSPQSSSMSKNKEDWRDRDEDKKLHEGCKALFEPKQSDKKVGDDSNIKGFKNPSTKTKTEKEPHERHESHKSKTSGMDHPKTEEREMDETKEQEEHDFARKEGDEARDLCSETEEHETKECETKEHEHDFARKEVDKARDLCSETEEHEMKEGETKEQEHDFARKEGDEARVFYSDAISIAESSEGTSASGSTLTSKSNQSWYVGETLNSFVQWGNSLLDKANSPYGNAERDSQENADGTDRTKDDIRFSVIDTVGGFVDNTVGAVVENMYAELSAKPRRKKNKKRKNVVDTAVGAVVENMYAELYGDSSSSFEEDKSHYTAASHISLEISIKDALLYQSPADVEKIITDAMSKVLNDQNYQVGTKAHEIESLHRALQAATKASMPKKSAIDVDRITRDVVENITKELDDRLLVQTDEMKHLHTQIEKSALQAEMKALHEEKAALQAKNLALQKGKDVVHNTNNPAEKTTWEEEKAALKAELKELQEEKAALQAKNDTLEKEKDAMDAVNRMVALIQEKADLQAKNANLQREKDRIEADRRGLDPTYENGTTKTTSLLNSSPRSSAPGKKGSFFTRSSRALALSRDESKRPRALLSLRRSVGSLLHLLAPAPAVFSTSTRRYKKGGNRRFGSWKKRRGSAPPRPVDLESKVDTKNNRTRGQAPCTSKQSQPKNKTIQTKKLEPTGEDKSKPLVPKPTGEREEEPQTLTESYTAMEHVESIGQKMDLFLTKRTNERDQEPQTSNQFQTTKEPDKTAIQQLTNADDFKLCRSNSAEPRLELESYLSEDRCSGDLKSVMKKNSF